MLEKSLRNKIEEAFPEWSGELLSYKELKKRLKLIKPKGSASGVDVEPMTEAEADFVKLLGDELDKFNTFFLDKEEEYIIGLKNLQDRVAKAKDYSSDEKTKMRKEIVNLHGEIVLLVNYTALTYTGLVKMFKKYEKTTGGRLLRLPFIQKVLQDPFVPTDLLYELIKECETMKIAGGGLFPVNDEATRNNNLLSGLNELSQIEYVESLYMETTISALEALNLDHT